LETLVTIADAFPPDDSIDENNESSSSFRRAATTTFAPLVANASAVAFPIPLLAPVTSATFSFRLLVLIFF
jgi:hypothetical protein